MSLPAPAKPTRPDLNAPNQQLRQHLPSPAIASITTKSQIIKQPQQEEKKQSQNDSNNANQTTYPTIFDPKFNTKNINWSELYHTAVLKGRIMYVRNVIQSHYGSYLTNYDVEKKNNLPNIPNLSPEILTFIHQILYETSIVLNAHNLLHSHTNWETQVDDHEGISVYYRQEDTESGIHSIKVSFVSKCHPVDLIAVINEFDLMKEIVTICPMETRYLKEFTNLNKVVYSKINMWWPLKNRDAVAHVRAYDLLEEYDEVLIWGKTFDEIKGVEMPDVDKKTLRMDVTMAEGVIKPKLMENGELGTEVISSFNIDFKSFLPKTLLNWISRTFAYYAAKMIRDRTENLEGTTHQQRIEEKPIYKEWTQRYQDWKTTKLEQKSDEKL